MGADDFVAACRLAFRRDWRQQDNGFKNDSLTTLYLYLGSSPLSPRTILIKPSRNPSVFLAAAPQRPIVGILNFLKVHSLAIPTSRVIDVIGRVDIRSQRRSP